MNRFLCLATLGRCSRMVCHLSRLARRVPRSPVLRCAARRWSLGGIGSPRLFASLTGVKTLTLASEPARGANGANSSASALKTGAPLPTISPKGEAKRHLGALTRVDAMRRKIACMTLPVRRWVISADDRLSSLERKRARSNSLVMTSNGLVIGHNDMVSPYKYGRDVSRGTSFPQKLSTSDVSCHFNPSHVGSMLFMLPHVLSCHFSTFRPLSCHFSPFQPISVFDLVSAAEPTYKGLSALGKFARHTSRMRVLTRSFQLLHAS